MGCGEVLNHLLGVNGGVKLNHFTNGDCISLVTTSEISIEILFANPTAFMGNYPYLARVIFNHSGNGEIAHNLTDGFRGVDIHLVNVSALEYPFTVLIHLLALKDGLTEGWSYG